MNFADLTHITQDVGPFLDHTMFHLKELGLSAYMLTDAMPGLDGTYVEFRERLTTLLDPILRDTFGPTTPSDFMATVFAVVLTKADHEPKPDEIEACVTLAWYADGDPFRLGVDLGCYTVKPGLDTETGLAMVNAVECFLMALIYKNDDDTLEDFMRRSNNEISMVCRVDAGDLGHAQLVNSLCFYKTEDDWGQVAGIDEVFLREVLFSTMTPRDSPAFSDTY